MYKFCKIIKIYFSLNLSTYMYHENISRIFSMYTVLNSFTKCIVMRITFSFLEFYKDSNVNRQALAIVWIIAHHPENVIHVA